MQPWRLVHQVLQADKCGRSVSFQAALGFPSSASSDQSCCFLVERPATSAVVSCSMVFICLHCSSDSAAATQLSLSYNITWVTKFMHLQFLRLGTFPLGRRLEVKGDFAAYQPVIIEAVCTWLHSVWYVSRVTLRG